MHTRQIVIDTSAGRHSHGFSLIETIVVLTMAGIALAAGLPSYNNLIQRQRERTTTHLLSAFMTSARNTAITHRQRTVVCPHNGNGQCRGDSDWTQGWIMFYDADRDDRPDTSQAVLRVQSAVNDATLRVVSTNGRHAVTFLPNGSTPGSNLTIQLCRGGMTKAEVIVNRMGRARVEKPHAPAACEAGTLPP